MERYIVGALIGLSLQFFTASLIEEWPYWTSFLSIMVFGVAIGHIIDKVYSK